MKTHIVGIIILLVVLVGCSSANVATQQTKEPNKAIATPTDNITPTTEAEPTETIAEQPTPDPNHGIAFADPVVFRSSGFDTVATLVTNSTDQVKSFTTQATYKTGDNIVGHAIGAVNDLLPGQTRVVSMLAQESIPETFDTVRVSVDTMIREAGTTDQSAIATQITFGPPSVTGSTGLQMINVEVTNGHDQAHSLTVQAAAIRDGVLVGSGIGAVNDIAPGQTKTATLIVSGEVEDAEINLAVDTVVK